MFTWAFTVNSLMNQGAKFYIFETELKRLIQQFKVYVLSRQNF